MPWSEFDMRTACLEVRKVGGIRKAAKKYQIPYTTLYGRLNGTLPHTVAHQDFQRLSIDQEDLLADWVLFQSSLGDAPTHQQIRDLAQRIASERGDGEKIGKRWVRHFIARHPVLKTQKPRRIDAARIKCATAEVIRPWFNYLRIPAVQAIPPEFRWNMDEAGLMEGLGSNGYVVGNAQRRSIAAKKPDSRTWILLDSALQLA
jgi:4-hydroxybenzoate polyprenyltransferase